MTKATVNRNHNCKITLTWKTDTTLGYVGYKGDI